MDNATVTLIAAALRVSLFREPQRSSARASAQDQLNDITPYVRDNTLRFHHSRINGCAPMFDGLFFRITESVSLDMHNTKRGTRCVLFDLTGRTVFHPSLSDTRASCGAALKQYHQWADTFDPIAYYREKLTANAARLEAQADDMRSLARSLEA
jgi:hypothetical protein